MESNSDEAKTVFVPDVNRSAKLLELSNESFRTFEQKNAINFLARTILMSGSQSTYEVSWETENVCVTWSQHDRYLEVEIFPNGLCEWFVSIPTSGKECEIDGTNDEQEPIPLERISNYLSSFF